MCRQVLPQAQLHALNACPGNHHAIVRAQLGRGHSQLQPFLLCNRLCITRCGSRFLHSAHTRSSNRGLRMPPIPPMSGSIEHGQMEAPVTCQRASAAGCHGQGSYWTQSVVCGACPVGMGVSLPTCSFERRS